MLPRENRLVSNYEFRKVSFLSRKQNTGTSGDLFFLNYIKPFNYQGPTRFGIVVSNKIHRSAAGRNRIKRLLREVLRQHLGKIKDGYWVVIYPKYKIVDSTYEEINTDFAKVLQKLPFAG